MCNDCLMVAGEPPPPRCAGCKSLSENYQTCSSCRSWLDIYAVYVANSYEGLYKQLVRSYKFELQRQAVTPMAHMMSAIAVPYLTHTDTVLCPLPTAPKRIRARGFDHVMLLAKTFKKQLPSNVQNRMVLCSALHRHSNSRQMGSSRDQRIRQISNEFYITNPSLVLNRHVVIIDDVSTTGASLAAAARTLKDAGAARIYAVVFAQKI